METPKQKTWQVVSTGPLGDGDEYQVHILGDVSAARITHILDHLALARSWLEQDEIAKAAKADPALSPQPQT